MTKKIDPDKSMTLIWLLVLFIPFVIALAGMRPPGSGDRPKTIQEQIREESNPRYQFNRALENYRRSTSQDTVFASLDSKKEWNDDDRMQCSSAKLQALHGGTTEEFWKWTELEARHGNTDSALLLGATLYEGKLLPQNKEKALEWISLAAEGNHSKAIRLRDLIRAEGRERQSTGIQAPILPKQQGN